MQAIAALGIILMKFSARVRPCHHTVCGFTWADTNKSEQPIERLGERVRILVQFNSSVDISVRKCCLCDIFLHVAGFVRQLQPLLRWQLRHAFHRDAHAAYTSERQP